MQVKRKAFGTIRGDWMRKLGVVGLVLAGLAIAAQGIGSIVYPLTALQYSEPGLPRAAALLTVLIPVVLVGFGVLLIVGRLRLAKRWFDDDEGEFPLVDASLLRLALIAMGVWLLAASIPSLLSLPTQLVARTTFVSDDLGMSAPSFAQAFWQMLPQLVAVIAEGALGALLIWRSRPLASWLWGGTPSAGERGATLAGCPACGAPYCPDDYRGGMGKPRCSSCGAPLPPEGPEQAPQPAAP